jgi:hypothetical protein
MVIAHLQNSTTRSTKKINKKSATTRSCCRTFLVDLLGVVDTALSTSHFGVIGVKSLFLDHVLFLVS